MAFRWRADDGSLIVVFGSFLTRQTEKDVVKVGPLWTRACLNGLVYTAQNLVRVKDIILHISMIEDYIIKVLLSQYIHVNEVFC